MSNNDNWLKLYHWWQEHLQFRLLASSSSTSSTIIDEDLLNNRHSSLTSIRPMKESQLITTKKRSSVGELPEHSISHHHHDFRHVRDSIRGRNPRTTRIKSINQRSVELELILTHILLDSRTDIHL